MKKLFILYLCSMFFVQNVEAGIFCGWWHHRLNECRAEKSAVEKKYRNETEQYSICQEQYSNCQEQYSNCQAERDSYKFWHNFCIGGVGVLTIIAVAIGEFACHQRLQINKLKRQINRLHRPPDPYYAVNG